MQTFKKYKFDACHNLFFSAILRYKIPNGISLRTSGGMDPARPECPSVTRVYRRMSTIALIIIVMMYPLGCQAAEAPKAPVETTVKPTQAQEAKAAEESAEKARQEELRQQELQRQQEELKKQEEIIQARQAAKTSETSTKSPTAPSETKPAETTETTKEAIDIESLFETKGPKKGQVTKPVLEDVSGTAALIQPLETELGKNVSRCLQQEIQKSLPNFTGLARENAAYIQAYTNLMVYERIKFNIQTSAKESSYNWNTVRSTALAAFYGKSFDPTYQRLIRAFYQARSALAEKTAEYNITIPDEPPVTSTACKQSVFKLVGEWTR
jgi:hypothetical protein